jgi:hypothetical protein
LCPWLSGLVFHCDHFCLSCWTWTFLGSGTVFYSSQCSLPPSDCSSCCPHSNNSSCPLMPTGCFALPTCLCLVSEQQDTEDRAPPLCSLDGRLVGLIPVNRRRKMLNMQRLDPSAQWGHDPHFRTWSRAWRCTPVIPALRRQRQEDPEFQASLGYFETCLNPLLSPLPQKSEDLEIQP